MFLWMEGSEILCIKLLSFKQIEFEIVDPQTI